MSQPADHERAGVSMEFLSATALRAIPVIGHFASRHPARIEVSQRSIRRLLGQVFGQW